jgi:hypothetical protein
MAAKRPTYSAADETAFTTEVDGKCPLCGKALFYKKGKRKFKGYEIAHIYPLSAKPEDVLELKDEERLSSDLNAFENLIALCVECHTQFDKPRTAVEYRRLVAIKRALIRRAEQQQIQTQYHLQEDIIRVIDGLDSLAAISPDLALNYDPRKVDDKLDSTMPLPTKNKIKHNVSDYYQYVRLRFEEIERDTPNLSELVSIQVKAFYTQQKALELSQHVIFTNVVNWFVAKTNPKTIEAAEIVASYFVQNCEVFE